MILARVNRTWMPGPEAGLLLVLVILVATPGRPAWVATLQGTDRLDSELDEARALGYYEGLLDSVAPALTARRASPENKGPAADAPRPGSVTFRDAGLIEPDPGFLLLRLRPDVDLPWNGTRFRTNALGFRGPDAEPTKAPGTFRVVVLGSSNTMGHGVEDRETYARHLERWLAGRIGPGRRVEVLNLAVSSYAPTQRFHRLTTEVEALDPDWILADASPLDLYLSEHHLGEVVRRGVSIPYAFVLRALERADVSAADTPEEFGRKLRDVYSELLDGTYAGMAEEAQRLGVPLTVAILPRADSKEESPAIVALLAETARRHDLPCLDLSGAFRDLPLDALRVSPWDKHPSVLGHRRIFEHLRDALAGSGGVPGLPTGS